MDEYYVGTYWLVRREPAESCAVRTESFFRRLAACDPSLAHWFRKGRTLKKALRHRIETDSASLLTAFRQQEQEEGRFPTDGFSLRGWNGEVREAASSIDLRCGDASLWVPNICLFSPPQEGAAAERFLQVPMLTRILSVMAATWEPEWGIVTSHELRDTLSESPKTGTFVGWLTYFSLRRGEVPPLPAPVQVEPVEDKGTLVILTPERLTASNSAHVALAREVSERLGHAGLLTPLRPWREDSAS